jgi:hypothetical protein
MNHPEVIAALVGAIGAISGAIAWGIRKTFITLSDYLKELKPNSGTSIKDQINRLEERVDDIYKIIARRK